MRSLNTVWLFILTTVLFYGCREKIQHELGLWEIRGDGGSNPGAEWRKMKGSPENINTLQSFGGVLYMGGENDDAYLYFLQDSTFKNALPGTMIGGPIADLQVIGNRMWAGGSFSYHQSFKNYENLIYLEGGNISGIKFGNWLYSEIKGLTELNNDLIVRGWFHTSGTTHTGIKTSYIERVKNNTVVGFGSDILKEEVNNFSVFQNTLYVTGEGEFYKDVHLCGYWDGNNLVNSGLFDKSGILDNGQGLGAYMGELYLTHDKTWATDKELVQRFDGSSWHDVEGVSVFGGKKTNFKVINDQLYFFGEGVTIDGALESNVLKYDGSKWSAVGALTRTIVDIEEHNGTLYAATKDGLYEFK